MSTSMDECRQPKETGQCKGAGPSELVCRHCEADCEDRVTYAEKLANDFRQKNQMIDELLFGFYRNYSL